MRTGSIPEKDWIIPGNTRASRRRFSNRRGFTIVELLTVVATICILVGLMLPAVQQAREGARRLQCRSNLMQIGLALRNYESAHGSLPPGVVDPNPPIVNKDKGYHFGWIVQILPYLEASNVYRNFDFSVGVYDKRNADAISATIAMLHCPTMWGSGTASAYAACHHDDEAPIDVDNMGVMFANSHVRRDDIEDGAANTIFAGEVADPGPFHWASGTSSTLRNTGSPINGTNGPPAGAAPITQPARPPSWVGGFGSKHDGGAHFLFGDGSARFLGDRISIAVYQRLGNRADGELTELPY